MNKGNRWPYDARERTVDALAKLLVWYASRPATANDTQRTATPTESPRKAG